ncbi:uncharacterized protein L969DRAFT_24990 [Mixia osmundae IAM 14324]|uniref:Major facilitator superfamily (MFS) profile domain-containing protein n=1 Tax=Mixia osmundae (strain CBS 9802 / IAM 14324 / JCM 22182 / KY 12970) TaxID=764103 RepID=G7E7V9_MIXOS|nr:uncharacterized protein L969DRAFT_24990 [Mixia osmundae IAM 14324]KEI38520.1 hypothetical protein L969DRAFT_24990 [Mixia osmundae IAM 14324]GAA98919.1 hypothetical protein E5Q_05607 [Mixia osmundae IAM 14324]
MTTFQERWHLDPSVGILNVCAYATSAFASIAFIVFVNTTQPAVLQEIVGIKDNLANINGNLLVADELLALIAVLLFGAIADRVTPRPVAVSGHYLIALSLPIFVSSKRAFPDMLAARLVYALGSAALTTMLTAVLASMTAVTVAQPMPAERQPLLQEENAVNKLAQAVPEPPNATRLAGCVGMATGLGAVTSVFVLVRLPSHFTQHSIASAIRLSYYIVAIAALCEGTFLIYGLKRKTASPVKTVARPFNPRHDLQTGFKLLASDANVALACLSGFAARSQTILVSAMIPVLILQYSRQDDCQPASVPGDRPKCPSALVLTAQITGTAQLCGLIAAPLVGFLGGRLRLRARHRLLACAFALGATGSLCFALMPKGNARYPSVWPGAVLLGLSQVSGIVLSLALCASARSHLKAKDNEELAGRIAGVYSLSGGLGILLLSKLAASFADKTPSFPFFLMVGIDSVTALAALFVSFRS